MASDLFNAMLDMDCKPSSNSPTEFDGKAVNASIKISGDWNAEFEAIATTDLAAQIACAMFGMSPGELSENEIYDAMGEVINVIGGNAKGIIDSECNLSLPCVGTLQPNGREGRTNFTFECDGHPLTITLLETHPS